jgi:hypothetical protein
MPYISLTHSLMIIPLMLKNLYTHLPTIHNYLSNTLNPIPHSILIAISIDLLLYSKNLYSYY